MPGGAGARKARFGEGTACGVLAALRRSSAGSMGEVGCCHVYWASASHEKPEMLVKIHETDQRLWKGGLRLVRKLKVLSVFAFWDGGGSKPKSQELA